ncbi:MAG: GtrA family protein [Clostridia bacterium]|nr:GtrA family protein [Clostridia bacterium]
MTENRRNFKQLIKFGVVGVMNTAVDFLAYQLLTFLGVNYAAAQCISYSCGVLNSYIFNSSWTFKEAAKHERGEFISFIAVNLISLGISVALLKVCYDVLGIESNLVSKAIVTPIVMIINFIGTKLLVFKNKK